jgi:hypothetical protein
MKNAKILTAGATALFAAVLCLQAQSTTSTQTSTQRQPSPTTTPPSYTPPPSRSDDMTVRYSSDPQQQSGSTATQSSTARDTLGVQSSTSADQSSALSGSTSTFGAQSNVTTTAQTDTEVRTIVQQIDQQGPAVVQRATTQFADLACTEENARQIMTALRNGTSVTLTGDDGESATFAPTGQLGYGEAYIAMALAAETLRANGVTDCAKPEQWRAVFLGGPLSAAGTTTTTASTTSTTSFPGILVLREQGQGWGQIARTSNVQLGQVVSSARSSLNLRSDAALSGSTGEMDTQTSDSRTGTSAYGSSTSSDRDSSLKTRDQQKPDPRNQNAWEKSANKDDKEMNSSDRSAHHRDTLGSSTRDSSAKSAIGSDKSTTRSTDDGSRWDKSKDKKKDPKNDDEDDDKYRPKN